MLFDEEGGGGALAYSKSGGLTYAVYIRKTDGSPAVLLGEGGAVALSPDGKWAISQTQESPSQFSLLPTGAGEPRDLTKDNVNHSWAHWFPDGKRILFSADEPGKGVRFYVYELASGKSQAISQEGVNGTAFALSPDSQQIAAIGPDQKGYLYPVAGGDPHLIAGINPGEQPITWSRRRPLTLHLPTWRITRPRLPPRHANRPAHTLERADALRPRRSRKHRPHLHDPRRQNLRLRLPPHARRSLSSRRIEITSNARGVGGLGCPVDLFIF